MGSCLTTSALPDVHESPLGPSAIETRDCEKRSLFDDAEDDDVEGKSFISDSGQDDTEPKHESIPSHETVSANDTTGAGPRLSGATRLAHRSKGTEDYRSEIRSRDRQNRRESSAGSAARDVEDFQRTVEEVDSLEVSPSPVTGTESPTMTTETHNPWPPSPVDDDEEEEEEPVPVAAVVQLDDDRTLALTLVSVPVQCTTSGAGVCEPPLVAELVVRRTCTAATSSPRTASPTASNSADFVARVILRDEKNRDCASDGTSGSATTTPSMTGELSVIGRRFTSPSGEDAIYFVFPDLQVLKAGFWRLGVSITQECTTREPDADTHRRRENDGGRGGGRRVEEALVQSESTVATLAVPAGSPLAVGRVQVGSRTAEILDVLAAQGARTRGSHRV